MKWDGAFWNTVWSRPYGRYNRHHKEIWEALTPFIQGKVVDLGVGTALLYQGKDVDLTGVDFSSQGIEEAKKNYPSGKYLVADVRDTRLPDKFFDTCIISGVLDYFEDWEEVLVEARRITKGNIMATLLHGFQGHDWSHIEGIKKVGNWVIIKV